MTLPKVYAAGPIAGCDKNEANDWRNFLQDRLKETARVVSPLRREPKVSGRYELSYSDPRFGAASAISGKNWFDTANCDLILAYLPKELNDRKPSYGTVIEIGWAIGMRKPIILITDDEYLMNHPLISRNVDWVLDNFDEAVDVIEGLLGVYGND